ncbi:CerR family C-terminal domain-containing protein [Blastopirellula marina]|uniref:Transcriptional regulator, TetR family protein n=1 Tax=Blastopirellula marina DSM 3645 TaxID=314230 RepID=A4A0Z1_9BACT|nr:CerR family C-terminal domain-containing protein [Blastopirellula marina]EAQ77558.1 transcriptional regulator, TetR family protein [Blastopirellula marina DSM 3645]
MGNDDPASKIIAAALEEFSEKGFRAATIRDICAKAGVNLAAVNYYFGDKKKLYSAVFKQAHISAHDAYPMPQWEADESPESRLRDFIRVSLLRMRSKTDTSACHRLMMREFAQPTGVVEELVEEFFRPHHKLLVSILQEIVGPHVQEFRLHQLAFSLIGQCLFYRFNQPVLHMLVPQEMLDEHFGTEDLAEYIYRFVLAALQHGGWDLPLESQALAPDSAEKSVKGNH